MKIPSVWFIILSPYLKVFYGTQHSRDYDENLLDLDLEPFQSKDHAEYLDK